MDIDCFGLNRHHKVVLVVDDLRQNHYVVQETAYCQLQLLSYKHAFHLVLQSCPSEYGHLLRLRLPFFKKFAMFSACFLQATQLIKSASLSPEAL